MKAVFFTPLAGDPLSGPITQVSEGSEATWIAVGQSYVEIEDAHYPWDTTHKVVDGLVVPK